jgi:hypothetical protein
VTKVHKCTNDRVQGRLAVAVLALKNVHSVIAAKLDAASRPGQRRDNLECEGTCRRLEKSFQVDWHFTLRWKQRHGTTRSQHMHMCDPSASKNAQSTCVTEPQPRPTLPGVDSSLASCRALCYNTYVNELLRLHSWRKTAQYSPTAFVSMMITTAQFL